jgi:uncharacterized membrane protein YfcA
MRPLGSLVHLRKGTVNLRLVGFLAMGSVPTAFLGAYVLHLFGESTNAQTNVERALGSALLLGAGALVLRYVMDRRSRNARRGVITDITVHPVRTVMVGMVGGFVVGMTSVGAGSLMIVLLLFLYPTIGANQLVGTDLTQALPLTTAAALGALAFGHVSFGVTTSLIIGSVPAVIVGSFFSSRAPDRYIRPVITFVIFASGLKYVGVGTTRLGWTLVGVLAAGFVVWLMTAKPWLNGSPSQAAAPPDESGSDDAVPVSAQT